MWILACDETVGVTWECVMILGKMLFNDIWDRGEFTCFTLIFYTTSLNSKWFMTEIFVLELMELWKNLKVCSLEFNQKGLKSL